MVIRSPLAEAHSAWCIPSKKKPYDSLTLINTHTHTHTYTYTVSLFMTSFLYRRFHPVLLYARRTRRPWQSIFLDDWDIYMYIYTRSKRNLALPTHARAHTHIHTKAPNFSPLSLREPCRLRLAPQNQKRDRGRCINNNSSRVVVIVAL